jgi:4-amino-4-deoxy-L-arabinose transferase-like glycosyltransferase
MIHGKKIVVVRNKSAGQSAQLLVLTLIVVGCLVPFAGKAFNIDEPLFLWTARQIQSHPLDFFGFTANWYGFEMPASQIIKNPPLASYYISLAAYPFGWSEWALHLAFLPFALAAAAGTFLLAKEFSSRPLVAALTCMLTPAFLVSSTAVMCDTMMLAFFVWAVLLWVRGWKTGKVLYLICASFLVALCSLTKYFGGTLLPLLLTYSLADRGGKKRRALLLLLPVILLCAYQWSTSALYGRGLLLDAAEYATGPGKTSAISADFFTGLSFTGGCLLSSAFFAPFLWRRRYFAPAAVAVVACAFLFPVVAWQIPLPDAAAWGYALQFSLFVAAGIHVLFLAWRDLWKHRDADSLLLFLWVAGTFLFASRVNWTINARSILPMAPVVGILIARRLEEHRGETHPMPAWRSTLPLVPALVVALLVGWSDYRFAGTARAAAAEISRTYGGTSASLWFQGHWGFQYYMEAAGARALDRDRGQISYGDFLAIPGNNTNVNPAPQKSGLPFRTLEFAPARFLSTMNDRTRAGFYSSVKGPLPFVFSPVPMEVYYILEIRKTQ